ncbi:MAG: glycosyltransferase family 39 protein [Thermosynechococcaceae cyanobacterium]
MHSSTRAWPHGLTQLWQYVLQKSILLPLTVGLAIALLLISPVGEFPLNDDWIYSKTVQHLVDTGQYQAHPYLNATLVVQTYWAALFCKLFGFSFTTLRISTLVLALINAWAVARSALVMGLGRNLALLCGLMIATSPLVFQLSYSFMTDVPFLALSSLSGLCFLKALKQPKPKWGFWGSVLAVLAFWVRQFGILVPFAFAIAAAILARRQPHLFPRRMQIAVLVPWGISFAAYLLWANSLNSDTPILKANIAWAVSLVDGIRHIPVALCYMGLFTLPLGMGRAGQMVAGQTQWTRQRWRLFCGFCSIALFTFWLPQILYWIKRLIFHDEAVWLRDYACRMPLMKYKALLDFGFGPLQLPDPHPHTTVQIHDGWWLITLPSLWGAGLLFMSLLDRWHSLRLPIRDLKEQGDRNQDVFLAVWGVVCLLSTYNPFRPETLDRYFLPALVPFLLLLTRDFAQVKGKSALKPILIAAVLIALFSLLSLQDYLAWNRAAWVGHRTLEARYQATPQTVAGIDTFAGWYNSEAYMERFQTRSWWDANKGEKGPWVLDDQYVVTSASMRSGYDVLARIPYWSWIGFRQKNIALLKRSAHISESRQSSWRQIAS